MFNSYAKLPEGSFNSTMDHGLIVFMDCYFWNDKASPSHRTQRPDFVWIHGHILKNSRRAAHGRLDIIGHINIDRD